MSCLLGMAGSTFIGWILIKCAKVFWHFRFSSKSNRSIWLVGFLVDTFTMKMSVNNNKPCIMCSNDKETRWILELNTDDYWKEDDVWIQLGRGQKLFEDIVLLLSDRCLFTEVFLSSSIVVITSCLKDVGVFQRIFWARFVPGDDWWRDSS